ncbi:MAG: F0F1 ATP synthase subunit gamma [Patescibacteria group bacterium]|nr:F0F1 ATP synthase subunit gamma [Patescibacteria group bacterium]MCL5432286.1 F0F1 ATP synthase subunit gamma [Patescibacteria group bacterium]
MYQINKIKDYLNEVESLELLAQVFTDIARSNLERIRAGIERNRTYVGEVAKVLHVVRVTAEAQGLSATRQKKVSASLLITSNKRLYYGDLDTKVAEFYIAHTAYTGYVDRFVLGSVGADILKGSNYPFAYETIIFDQELPSAQELANLSQKLSGYQKVFVYYPRFVTVLSQLPSLVDITGLVSSVSSGEEDRYYIFEPEIGKILDFFEQQIIQMLLEQAFLEAQLARIGTQLTTMDQAAQNAAAVIKQQNELLTYTRKQYLNLQSLEIAGTIIREKDHEE